MYSEKVMDHFQNPRNVGEIENASGVGTVGNAKCGDIMRMYLDIDDNGVIQAPGTFVDLAVELGLIDELTHLVLAEIMKSIDLINATFGEQASISVNVAAKQAIAQSAIELVNDGDTLLVDSGTTALEFVRLLDQRDGITVITADITIADYIDESMPSVDVVMLGGALRKGHRYLYGPLTMQALQMVHADLAVMCPGAFVPGCGFTTDFPQMAETKAAMVGAARQSVALMDASKVNGRGMYRFAELADVDTIVMDRDPDHAVATSIAEIVDDARPNLLIAGA